MCRAALQRSPPGGPGRGGSELVVPARETGKGCLEARAGRPREPDGELAWQAVLIFQGCPDPLA